jgi:hypothetical protein
MKELNFISDYFRIEDLEGKEHWPGKIIYTNFQFCCGDLLCFYAYKKTPNVVTFNDFGGLYWEKFAKTGDFNWKDKLTPKIKEIIEYYGVSQDEDVFYLTCNETYSVDYQFTRFLQCLINLIYLLQI